MHQTVVVTAVAAVAMDFVGWGRLHIGPALWVLID